ncbi:GerMN domain-containing protein [Sphaerochaeta sp.]|uniref:GerMN domain-containing protein n=1 Tax=Sphaerochaeta sp. TaxID=1972642 RepID=UPI002FCC525D
MDTNRPESKTSAKRPLLMVLIWVLFTLTIVAFGYPRVKQAVVESGVLSLLDQATEAKQYTNVRSVRVAFASFDGSYPLSTVSQPRLGGSVYHDTFEALLGGPTQEALKQGQMSFIAPGTKLRGLTLSNKILFVDVSKEYLQSPDMQKAYAQMKQTSLGFSNVKDLVVLVEGRMIR